MNLSSVQKQRQAGASMAAGGHSLSSQAAYIDFSAINILSKKGIYACGQEERKFLCLLSDDRLLIAEGHGLNPHVLSYRARLERMKHAYSAVFTPIATIHEAYQVDAPDDGGRRQEHSMMQVTAKGLLTKACLDRASDIHIRVRKHSTEFYFRIHNDLVKVGAQTREYGERLLATMYGAMTAVSDNSYKPTERQDASIGDRDKLPDMLYGVRIATAPTNEGSVMILRLLYNDAGENSDVRHLGFDAVQAGQVQVLKEQPIGLNIISGPTGSGKSTTLQHVLAGEIAESDGRIHVLTIEDPIEYPIAGAVQTSVTNASTEEERSRLFSAAIANAMRLDPDTMMIGEIRDRASAQNGLRAAMTGHQVWTTVHANSALAIVDRLVDLGLPLSLVADHSVVTGLVSQRLVKLLCQHCKKKLVEHEHEVSGAILARVRRTVGAALPAVCIAGPGCEHCRSQGTTGRTVVAEVILPDPRFYEYIRAGEKIRAYEYWLRELGGKTILQHAIEKVAAGMVDPRMAEKTVGHLRTQHHLNGTADAA
ncbi:type II secretory ATPase GspE/PulE/Tfp pilus assembly ATPase PilB-like protein [Collimonas sp. PA-H2]|uniref:GspE/PulE family protein n=1 Tax=Collimonas sp. PA-H2 TaxID=1881062 RepID=UPI000BF4A293|nr:ATPase, T2SS/T4P/T4SS family [Collimonas sp. PA-H2]PFH10284.1 type II secretory ATPase GspE/PulE/Tfp pilus assembly ATPase PilB-like protein [Collimonas sp. PA-H2]